MDILFSLCPILIIHNRNPLPYPISTLFSFNNFITSLSSITDCQQLSVVRRTQSSCRIPTTNGRKTSTRNNTTTSGNLTGGNIGQCGFGACVQPWVEESKTGFTGGNTVRVDELDYGTEGWGCARGTVDEFGTAGSDDYD